MRSRTGTWTTSSRPGGGPSAPHHAEEFYVEISRAQGPGGTGDRLCQGPAGATETATGERIAALEANRGGEANNAGSRARRGPGWRPGEQGAGHAGAGVRTGGGKDPRTEERPIASSAVMHKTPEVACRERPTLDLDSPPELDCQRYPCGFDRRAQGSRRPLLFLAGINAHFRLCRRIQSLLRGAQVTFLEMAGPATHCSRRCYSPITISGDQVLHGKVSGTSRQSVETPETGCVSPPLCHYRPRVEIYFGPLPQPQGLGAACTTAWDPAYGEVSRTEEKARTSISPCIC